MDNSIVGIVLSGATTSEASCQLLKSAENGNVHEGMLLMLITERNKILCRVAKVLPYNAFYTEGDPWSEARREGKKIPDEIARQYEICKLDLLLSIDRDQKNILYPPKPGDKVHLVDINSINYGELFNIHKEPFPETQRYKGIIQYGSLSGYGSLQVPLDVEKMPMHIAIFGVTGSGKSFNSGYLIEKLLSIPKDEQRNVAYPLIIVDAHGDYIDYVGQEEQKDAGGRSKFSSGKIKRYVFPKVYTESVELRRNKHMQPISLNLNELEPQELAEIVVTYLKGRIEGSDQQIASLIDAFTNLKPDHSFEQLFTTNYGALINYINGMNSIHGSTKAAIIRQCEAFHSLEQKYRLFTTQSDIKSADFVDKLTDGKGVAIIDFSAEGAPGIDLRIKQVILTYIATVLFRRFSEYKIQGHQKFLALLIEETQNFCPDKSYPLGFSLAYSKLSAIATQGRKFGLSLILISQRPSFVDKIIVSMCNTFLIQRVSPEDVSFVKSVTGGLPQSLVNRLTTLDTGELILTGQMITVPFPLLVNVQYNQRLIKPTIGETNVIDNL